MYSTVVRRCVLSRRRPHFPYERMKFRPQKFEAPAHLCHEAETLRKLRGRLAPENKHTMPRDVARRSSVFSSLNALSRACVMHARY